MNRKSIHKRTGLSPGFHPFGEYSGVRLGMSPSEFPNWDMRKKEKRRELVPAPPAFGVIRV
jgi:hypothetical protein